MEEEFSWGGHLHILLVLVTIASDALNTLPIYMVGGIAYIIIAALLHLIFGIPVIHLQVSKQKVFISKVVILFALLLLLLLLLLLCWSCC